MFLQYLSRRIFTPVVLKGLSHEIFGPFFGLYGCTYLGLNVKRLRFLNFNAAPLILDN
jgi:hypothetical protein